MVSLCALFTPTTQVICLLIFLKRKWKSSCFNSCLIVRDRDESSGMQHFHEISNTIPQLCHCKGSILMKNPESLPKKCSHIVNIGLKSNQYLKEQWGGGWKEEI